MPNDKIVAIAICQHGSKHFIYINPVVASIAIKLQCLGVGAKHSMLFKDPPGNSNMQQGLGATQQPFKVDIIITVSVFLRWKLNDREAKLSYQS